MLLIQQLVNGLLVGGTYVLFALGLSLTMGILKIFNLAHGATLTVATITAVAVADRTGIGFWGVLAVGAAAGAVVGACLDFVAFRFLRRRSYARQDDREQTTVVASLALLIILQTLAQIYTETRALQFPEGTFTGGSISFGGITVRSISVVMFVVSIILTLIVWLVVSKTKSGRALRAVAVDTEAAEMLGIASDRYNVSTLALAGAMAGVAGVLIGLAFYNISFIMGEAYLLRGLVVLVIGGIGSIPGTLVGGLGLGLIEGMTVHFLGSAWRELVGFGIMMLVLIYRPYGIFGKKAIDRA